MNNIYTTFFALLLKDIKVFNKQLSSRSIDAAIWITCTLLISTKIMPLFGIVDENYATFIFIGNIAVWGLFEMLTSVAMFVGDLQGDRSITYNLSLPMPSYLVFIEQAYISSYRSMASLIFILPIGKLMLGNSLRLVSINWPYFIFAFLMVNIFYGFFTIFIASYIPHLGVLSMVRSRIIFPLWFLGGFQFTWKMLYGVNPTAAYICLANPIIYVMDGIRSPVLPVNDYLPFWNCMGMLILFSAILGYFAIRKLYKRLDCV